MGIVQNKRGANYVYGVVIFLLLNLTVFVILGYGVSRSGSGVTLFEEAYAKKIALLLNGAESGMDIDIDLGEAFVVAHDKNFVPEIEVDCEGGRVIVKLSRSSGYLHEFYTDFDSCEVDLNKNRKRMLVRVRNE
tara:strand:+ start:247 stop:648 length:402 start_codon:yes stop_codon:yes gene_type:complete